MVQISKKIFVVSFVILVAWFGVLMGQGVTRQVVHVALAQAASSSSADDSSSSGALGGQQDRYKNLELFQKVLHFVENNYVEEVKNEELINGAIKGMMETLDPHSNFLPPDVFKDMKIDTSGKFGGLGIEIGVKDGVLTIIAPIEDTPAWKAGLKPNDRIVKINNESTKGMNLMEAVSKMRGKQGSKVIITIYRKGWDKIRDVSIVRDVIKIQAVKNEPLETGFGYVRLASFNENASEDIKKAIKKLEKETKLKGLVFDLRTNPGGLLDQAVEVASLFLDDGVIVSTMGRNKSQKEVKHVHKGYNRMDFPVAVLVNSSTASAAEIVAGALQDHHRAIIMGQPTFGKGSVQTVIELGRDMGLKLTIARYYTPSGRSIQEKGVEPDIVLDEYDPKLLEKAKLKADGLRERDLKAHLINEKDKDKDKKSNGDEFTQEELDSLGSKKKDEAGKDDKDADKDDMAPIKFEPKKDYQVKEALNYLKSYEIFKKITNGKPGEAQSSAMNDQNHVADGSGE